MGIYREAMRLPLLLWLAILAVSNSLDGDSGVASVSTSSTVVDKSLGKDGPAEDFESNLSLAAAVPSKVGETESDSAECIDARKVSSFACKSGQNQMCEVTQKASSDICNTKAKQASSREKESGDVVMNAKEDAVHLNQKISVRRSLLGKMRRNISVRRRRRRRRTRSPTKSPTRSPTKSPTRSPTKPTKAPTRTPTKSPTLPLTPSSDTVFPDTWDFHHDNSKRGEEF